MLSVLAGSGNALHSINIRRYIDRTLLRVEADVVVVEDENDDDKDDNNEGDKDDNILILQIILYIFGFKKIIKTANNCYNNGYNNGYNTAIITAIITAITATTFLVCVCV